MTSHAFDLYFIIMAVVSLALALANIIMHIRTERSRLALAAALVVFSGICLAFRYDLSIAIVSILVIILLALLAVDAVMRARRVKPSKPSGSKST